MIATMANPGKLSSGAYAANEAFINLALVLKADGGACPRTSGEEEKRSCRFDADSAQDAFNRLVERR